jgi:hypothetical protein
MAGSVIPASDASLCPGWLPSVLRCDLRPLRPLLPGHFTCPADLAITVHPHHRQTRLQQLFEQPAHVNFYFLFHAVFSLLAKYNPVDPVVAHRF